MRVVQFATLLLFLCATPLVAAPDRMSKAEEAAVQQALDRGTLIYAYDQAAWHGTDDFLAKAPDVIAQSAGWVVDRTASAPELIFFDKDAADPHALYIADFKDGELVSSKIPTPADNMTLSDSRKHLIAALHTTRDALLAATCPPAPTSRSIRSYCRPARPALPL